MGQDRAFLRRVALDPGTILTCHRLLDLRPLGVIMACGVHFAPDDADPLSLIGHL